MSQIDSKASITVAEESTKLALAAARDSSAMKSIAVVTMLFLPGTFVSVSYSHLPPLYCTLTLTIRIDVDPVCNAIFSRWR
jgi:hypothetical protein